ncbi:MAG: hypothetical protein ACQEP1_02570 [Nanobdellota archaeon]
MDRLIRDGKIREAYEELFLKTKKPIYGATQKNPEIAHSMFNASVKALGEGLCHPEIDHYLGDLTFGNAAGSNKNIDVSLNNMARLGYNLVVLGTFTYDPRKGNKRQRVWRFPDTESVVNNFGLNNIGAKFANRKLEKQRNDYDISVHVSIMHNPVLNDKSKYDKRDILLDLKKSYNEFRKNDKVTLFQHNISCPNTGENIEEFLKSLDEQLDVACEYSGDKGILLKLSPDMTHEEIYEVVQTANQYNPKVKGFVAFNTTTDHDKRYIRKSPGKGGASGPILSQNKYMNKLNFLNDIVNASWRDYEIKAVGGINHKNVCDRLMLNNVTGVEAYTSIIYGGPREIKDINKTIQKHRNYINK